MATVNFSVPDDVMDAFNNRRTDRHAGLESFDRAGPAYGYKVDRWATIGEVRADGPAAIAVEIPSYSLGLADPAVVRIPLPEP